MLKKLLFGAISIAFMTPGVALGAPREAPRGDAEDDTLELYTVEVDRGEAESLLEAGVDIEDPLETGDAGETEFEVIMSPAEAQTWEKRGLQLVEQPLPEEGDGAEHEVWRPYSGPGGIAEQLRELAQAHPRLLKLVVIGTSVQGQDIVAVKLTNRANQVADGSRPAVLYNSLMHAREWITGEMTMRLLEHYLDEYGSNRRLTGIVDSTELWFLPVMNPDGYDYTFTEGHRLMRKNMRDNDGDGEITNADGVDLNRNFPTHWGYDNQGSSPNPAHGAYRGSGPASEPETQAVVELMERVGFEFQLTYHSAAQRILYGVGYQVLTPTPDDHVFATLAGTDDNPAVPDYDPGLGAELYITNGNMIDHAHAEYGTLALTPEMSSCLTAAAYFDDDEYDEAYCDGRSRFEFPDSEELVAHEFEKNVPFAVAVADSALDPGNPVSPVGIEEPDFVVDDFASSYGAEQTVAVEAKNEFRRLRMHYRVDGGRAKTLSTTKWEGGERYGGDFTDYYGEYRAAVPGQSAGDEVEVWFSAVDPVTRSELRAWRSRGGDWRKFPRPRRISSEHFTYTVEAAADHDVLVVANTDYEGEQSGGVTEPRYVDHYGEALEANDYSWDLYDVTATGEAPHPLGVLDHYDAVVWYTGDNVVTEALAEKTATKLTLDLDLAFRDYLNEGGKLLATGKNIGYAQFSRVSYGTEGAPEKPCTEPGATCLYLPGDFFEYYLGGIRRKNQGGLDNSRNSVPIEGIDVPYGEFGWTLDGGDSAANQGSVDGTNDTGLGTVAWTPTSSVLPPEEFPQFTSRASSRWVGKTGINAASVTTEDSVLWGFGLEGVSTAEERASLVGRTLAHLVGDGS